MMYFHFGIHVLIDIIQTAYHSAPLPSIRDSAIDSTKARYISVIVLFCTLREALADHLILEASRAAKIKKSIYERLIADNRNYSQKQNNLIPSLIGKKWNAVCAELGPKYVTLNETLKTIAAKRNKFVHEGKVYCVSEDDAISCMESIPSLLELFVRIHNKYVQPEYFKGL